jgi:hypothetical protein
MKSSGGTVKAKTLVLRQNCDEIFTCLDEMFLPSIVDGVKQAIVEISLFITPYVLDCNDISELSTASLGEKVSFTLHVNHSGCLEILNAYAQEFHHLDEIKKGVRLKEDQELEDEVDMIAFDTLKLIMSHLQSFIVQLLQQVVATQGLLVFESAEHIIFEVDGSDVVYRIEPNQEEG